MSSTAYSHSQYSKKYKKQPVDSLIVSGGTKKEKELGDTLGQKLSLTRLSSKILIYALKTMVIWTLLLASALIIRRVISGEWKLNSHSFTGLKGYLISISTFAFYSYSSVAMVKSSLTILHFLVERFEKKLSEKFLYHFSKSKHFIFSAFSCLLVALAARKIFNVKELETLTPVSTSGSKPGSFNVISIAQFFNNYFENLTIDAFIIMFLDALAAARILILIQKIFLIEIAHNFDKRSTAQRKKEVQPVFLSIEELRAAYVSQKLSPKDLVEDEGMASFYEKLVGASDEMAEEIFAAVKSISGAEGNTLAKDEFFSILGEEKTNAIYNFFEDSECADLNLEQFKRGIQLVYQEKLNIENTLNDNDEIIVRIDELMVLIWRCVILFSTLMLFQFNTLYSGIAGFTSALAISAIIKDLAKDVSDSVILLFFYHPFDIGDVILIDGGQYTVKKIGFLITTCQEANNSLVYIKNSKLGGSIIRNFRRSSDQEETLTVNVHTSTPTELLDALESELNKFLYANSKDYYPTCSFGPISIINSQRSTFNISYMHRSNFQDRKIYSARCKKINLELFEAMKRLGIEAAPPA